MTDQRLLARPARPDRPAPSTSPAAEPLVLRFEEIGIDDIVRVGGKNASLGEMIRHLAPAGVRVPPGFAVTAAAWDALIASAGLGAAIDSALDSYRNGALALAEAGARIRTLIEDTPLPAAVESAILTAYAALGTASGARNLAVAVRSSATAEDLPDASFAGQQESYLNIRGPAALLAACRRCYASLFTDRAITYREAKGFDHRAVALSIGVQQMVRSDQGGAGVIFSLDTETGFADVVTISAAWGLGEPVVKGSVDPDLYRVFKPLLGDPGKVPIIERKLGGKAHRMRYRSNGGTRTVRTSRSERAAFVLVDAEILELARWAMAVEAHYGRAMDLEWAKDGDGRLFLVQARPETVHAARSGTRLRRWHLDDAGTALATGAAVGQAIAAGPVRSVKGPGDIADFPEGAILVAERTDPDWVPAMRRAAGIVTDHGGPTSHAAIVARELGVPAVVGTGNATSRLADGSEVTLDCTRGEQGRALAGRLRFHCEEVALDALPETRTRLMVNLAEPDAAFAWWQLPAKGVGLARMEFIISNLVRIHPMALVHPEQVDDAAARREIATLTRGFADPRDYFVETLALGIARIAAVYHPHPAIVRLSDFKTNEYASLVGGRAFEPAEENPMLGFRGASRYYHPRYKEGFALECRALKRVRETIGLDNVVVMVPFCRTPDEARKVIAELAANGLVRGEAGLQLYMMCEIPANVLRAEEFASLFDGFSIGSNDLTQLVLGVDRDSALLASAFDERDPAVTGMIADVIRRAHACGIKIGLCGQAPSNYPEFARFLVDQGIDSISLNPDSFLATLAAVADAEHALADGG